MPDETESEDTVELAQAQNKRLRHQANTILYWLRKKLKQLTLMLEYFAHNTTHTLRDFYSTHPGYTTESMLISTCKRSRICTKTFRKWRKQFILYGAFERDNRGLAQFGWILVRIAKLNSLFGLSHRKRYRLEILETGSTTICCLNFLLGASRPEYGRLRRPVGPSTAHRWMLSCGAKYEPRTQSYITVAHQRHDTLLYRT